jgi:hypothetical protein
LVPADTGANLPGAAGKSSRLLPFRPARQPVQTVHEGFTGPNLNRLGLGYGNARLRRNL